LPLLPFFRPGSAAPKNDRHQDGAATGIDCIRQHRTSGSVLPECAGRTSHDVSPPRVESLGLDIRFRSRRLIRGHLLSWALTRRLTASCLSPYLLYRVSKNRGLVPPLSRTAPLRGVFGVESRAAMMVDAVERSPGCPLRRTWRLRAVRGMSPHLELPLIALTRLQSISPTASRRIG
jgi:hypothetical protein